MIQNTFRTPPGKLYKFDYGTERANLEHYGQKDAPEYDPSKITSESISLWYGVHDKLVPEENVLLLLNDMKGKLGANLIDRQNSHPGCNLTDRKSPPTTSSRRCFSHWKQ